MLVLITVLYNGKQYTNKRYDPTEKSTRFAGRQSVESKMKH